MKTICGSKTRGWSPQYHRMRFSAAHPQAAAIAHFASAAASKFSTRDEFLKNLATLEETARNRKKERELRFQKTSDPSNGGDSQWIRPSRPLDGAVSPPVNKGSFGDLSTGANGEVDMKALAEAQLKQPLVMKWVSPNFMCEDGKPMQPRRSFMMEPVGDGSVFVVYGGTGLSGGPGSLSPEDTSSLFSGVRFTHSSANLPPIDFNDTFIMIERFKDPTSECFPPLPYVNETKAKADGTYKTATDASYPNRTRPYPFAIDDGCGSDNPKGLEEASKCICV